ncbi:MAG: hypothetical protein U9O94_08405 [Nanoarchaeota archaeon]|nr:hypothetical protein [Nanoarchaeota archaeon]
MIFLLSAAMGMFFGGSGFSLEVLQYASIADQVGVKATAEIGVPASATLGTKLVGLITGKLGFGLPNMLISLLVAVVGSVLAVLIGMVAYEYLHKKIFKGFPKSKTGKIATVFFHGGLFGGLLLGAYVGLPIIGTGIVLAINSIVSAWLVLLIFSANKKLTKFVPQI